MNNMILLILSIACVTTGCAGQELTAPSSLSSSNQRMQAASVAVAPPVVVVAPAPPTEPVIAPAPAEQQPVPPPDVQIGGPSDPCGGPCDLSPAPLPIPTIGTGDGATLIGTFTPPVTTVQPVAGVCLSGCWWEK